MVVGRGSVPGNGRGGGCDCGNSDAGCGGRYGDHGCVHDDRSGIAIVMGMIRVAAIQTNETFNQPSLQTPDKHNLCCKNRLYICTSLFYM